MQLTKMETGELQGVMLRVSTNDKAGWAEHVTKDIINHLPTVREMVEKRGTENLVERIASRSFFADNIFRDELHHVLALYGATSVEYGCLDVSYSKKPRYTNMLRRVADQAEIARYAFIARGQHEKYFRMDPK